MTLKMDTEMRSSVYRIGKYMRSLRQRRNLTQVAAANLAGITSTAVAYVERCSRLPRVDTLCVLLEVYGSSLERLAADLNL